MNDQLLKDKLEELIDAVEDCAQDVTSAFEWGSGTAGARGALRDAKIELMDFIVENFVQKSVMEEFARCVIRDCETVVKDNLITARRQ